MKLRACVAVAAIAALASAAASGQSPPPKKIQCWTDKSGSRMCGDNIPPEYAGTKRDVLQDGRVVDTVKGAKTPEEIAEEKRKQQAADEAARRADYDRALLETYRNSKDIESMRDERITLIDTRIQTVEKNAADTDHNLEGLRARVAALEKDKKPVDDKLAKQVKQFERAQKENADALTRYHAERNDVQTKFNRDLDRYNELRAAQKPAKPAVVPPKK
jgi:chromosome segregation ATPase